VQSQNAVIALLLLYALAAHELLGLAQLDSISLKRQTQRHAENLIQIPKLKLTATFAMMTIFSLPFSFIKVHVFESIQKLLALLNLLRMRHIFRNSTCIKFAIENAS
jgi:hypothetical protein